MTTVLMIAAALNACGEVKWVEPTAETRPWGICHLMGNAVEKAELAKEMRRWSEAGLGGVRLVPIYAVKGNDTRNIATMSPEFVSLLKDANALEIEVTNLGANRIRAMDRKGVEWKNFEDINMVGIDYKPLDASGWPIQPSGLIGPVKLELWD